MIHKDSFHFKPYLQIEHCGHNDFKHLNWLGLVMTACVGDDDNWCSTSVMGRRISISGRGK